jgi:hypothetical protein
MFVKEPEARTSARLTIKCHRAITAEALMHSGRVGIHKIRARLILTESGPSLLVVFDAELRGA